MKLSITFTFAAVTVTSSCATVSALDNHHDNAIGFRHNTLPCTDVLCDDDYAPVCGFDNKTYPNACIFQATNCHTNVTMAYLGPCRDRFVNNERVHSSASATSSNEKTPLIRDRTHSANEERGVSFHPGEATPLLTKEVPYSKLQRMIDEVVADDVLLAEGVHPYDYLKGLHDRFSTWDWKLFGSFTSWLKWLRTIFGLRVDKSAEPMKVLKRIDRAAKLRLAQLRPSIYADYVSYAKLYNKYHLIQVITEH
ncbi:Protease inhibitor protein [Plasmopara halstedii]|uniref:Protease inhibitor protein n=1 Tax=Plasmopara halstedii TaxID=4781 RepID=A0A0P1AVJ2_PLAHL|nr:Protease inhibitor protein [Plasmopara halstedii]CEG45230.1 Protease inhibitor protein [Plasmopara halstedii]|eukprot:XP_024581599.1 Protease inhibitor protein [Plasmopara halstedii]